ncbi:hypothetical protein WN944_006065 [Citrus x changshan-huyou]|uniref:Uncharacterized protein n=1 Tax=Citrus x changshan-huyou TaxID=2935761 RepID=A0AAP0MKD5_9ROSI
MANCAHFAHRLALGLMATSYGFMVLIFVVLLSTIYQFSSLSAADSSSSYRSLLVVQRNSNRIPRCNEMGSRSECSQNPKCKWCRSEALDDMCFSESEAWRLPHQSVCWSCPCCKAYATLLKKWSEFLRSIGIVVLGRWGNLGTR